METVARAGGRIEALCVDEGFGALDRANLERAVEGPAPPPESLPPVLPALRRLRVVRPRARLLLFLTRGGASLGSLVSLRAEARREPAARPGAAGDGAGRPGTRLMKHTPAGRTAESGG